MGGPLRAFSLVFLLFLMGAGTGKGLAQSMGEDHSTLYGNPGHRPSLMSSSWEEVVDYYSWKILQLEEEMRVGTGENGPSSDESESYMKFLMGEREKWSKLKDRPLIPRTSQLSILNGSCSLLVTHASEEFDYEKKAKQGIDQLVEDFLSQKPRTGSRWLVYLMSPQSLLSDHQWYTRHRCPHMALNSESGEHSLRLKTPKVIVAGGYFGKCHWRSVESVLENYQGPFPLEIGFPMTAIFTQSGSTLLEQWEKLEKKDPEKFWKNAILAMELEDFLERFPSLKLQIRTNQSTIREIGHGQHKVIFNFMK